MNNHATHIERSHQLADLIEANKVQIVSALGLIETYDAANDEIERSISALRGIETELSTTADDIDDLIICTFFPLNLPLYSLILFAIIPGAFADKVYVRAPEIMQKIIDELMVILNIPELFPQISVKSVSRFEFLHTYASKSDVILFTGRYENALAIQKVCPSALFIFNGGGVNPAVIFEDSDVIEATDKVFEMRTFNSGQDCAGTDAIFVHRSCLEPVVSQLIKKSNAVNVGNYGNNTTEIGPILKSDYVDKLSTYLEIENEQIVLKGSIDKANSVVNPSIIVKEIDQHSGEFHEFFAPIFYILVFDTEQEVINKLLTDDISAYSMYVSYFSAKDRLANINFARMLKNKIINDVEQGNEAYGGYGERANFVAFGSERICRPILISREIDLFYKNDRLV